MNTVRAGLMCLGTALYLAGGAQESETERELDPVTITATMNPIQASRTGRNITIIKGELFSRMPVNSVDELLRYLPGVEVQARGPMGSQSDIVLRGGTFQQVLVVLDGVRLNDPLTGHFSSYIPVAPAEIERIEILKGASSALYGSDAVGGVIHIITKTFAAKGEKAGHASGQLTVGEYGLVNGQAGGFYSNGKTSVGGGFLTNNAEGQPQRGTRGFFHLHTGSLSIGHRFSDTWQLQFRSTLDDRRFSAQNYYTTFASDTADERVRSNWNQLRLTHARNAGVFSLNLGYKGVEDTYRFNSAAPANNNRSKLFQTGATYSHRFSDRTDVVSGGQFFIRKIASNDRGNHEVSQGALFLSLNQLVGSALRVNPAVRLDWDERGGTEFIPQLNASLQLSEFSIRGSIGKTIRHADFTERFNNYNKTFVGSGSIGNPDLGAETSLSYELGTDLLLKNIKLSATYFQRNQEGLIDWVTTPYTAMPRRSHLSPAGTYALARNIANVTTSGYETDMQYNRSFAREKRLFATLGLLWLNSESSEAQPTFYVSSHARFLSNFGLQFYTPRFGFSINGIYKNRDPRTGTAIHAAVSRDYWVLNAKAEAFILEKKLSLFTQLDNVLNERYSDLLGSPMPGRWLMGGFRISL